ncbi:MAG: sensor histidine kinase [Aeromicrobium sp.]
MSRRPPRLRPWVLAVPPLLVLQVGGTFGAFANQVDARPPVAAVGIAVAGPLLLLLFDRWPTAVFGAVVALTGGYVLAGYPYGPVFATLSIVTVLTVVRGRRPVVWAGLLALLVAVQVRAIADGDWSWAWLSGATAWLLVLVGASEIVRLRGERVSAARRADRDARRRAADEERLQIARELHDVVAHHISLITVQAGVALHVVDRRPEQAHTALVAIKDASKEALVELRSLVGILRDEDDHAPRRPTGTLASLDDLVERSGHAGLVVRRSVRGEVRPLPSSVELAALRIVQEAITNVVRHASATSADIVLEYAETSLTVTVEDDGTGLPEGAGTDGTGIVGMRERAAALGGSLVVGPGDRGTRVRATLPVRDVA